MIRAVFFDLDDTLIEFPGGFVGLLGKVYAEAVIGGAPPDGYERFQRRFWNDSCGLWASMHAGAISGDQVRQRRLEGALAAVGMADSRLAQRLLALWDELNVEMPVLKPYALELLAALGGRVCVGLITDGFKTLQRRKLDRFGLWPYFRAVHISEECGVCKPFRGVFALALKAAGVQAAEAVMVGDNADCDIRGALGVGMGAIQMVTLGSTADTPEGALVATSLLEVAELLGCPLAVPLPES